MSAVRVVCADGQPTSWVPTYTAFFPEYYATAIQTETLVRDMGPKANDVYGVRHGRLARRIDGAVMPVPVWITEIGVNAREVGVGNPAAAEQLAAEAIARILMFYLNKGAERVYLFAASGGASDYGLTAPDASGDRPQPLGLQVIQRIAALMREHAAAGLRTDCPRPLRFALRAAAGSAIQFAGDGTERHPPVRNIDMLLLLPIRRQPGACLSRFISLHAKLGCQYSPKQ